MAAPPNEHAIAVGTILAGKYQVTREIGRGGMAAVYEAVHLALAKKVAVKVLAAELTNSAVVIERFFREARAVASVKSPYIVDVYDSSRLDDGRPFIAMELLEGESLYDRMARVRIIDPVTTVRVITQCAKGLTKAHAAGIVHRDLKPENIFLMRNEEGEEIAKLLDFGLAKFYSPVGTDEQTVRLTREGAVFGTPAYMSPEQVKGQGNVDHRADLWALGCMAFECLIGRPVWNTEQGVAMTFAAIAAAQLPVPSRIRSDLPVSFDEWFTKALQRNPDDRFQSAKELADALARALGSGSALSVPSLSEEPRAVRAPDPTAQESMPEGAMRSGSTGPLQVRGSVISMRGPSSPEPRIEERSSPLRAPGPSAADLPPTAAPESVVPPGLRAPGRLRVAATVVGVLGVAAAGYFSYLRWFHGEVPNPAASAAASAAASGTPAPQGAPPMASNATIDPLYAGVVEGLRSLWDRGDLPGALRKLRDVQQGPAGPGNALAGSLLEQLQVANVDNGGCEVRGLAHPRLENDRPGKRPSVAVTSRGVVLSSWIDDHSGVGEHAYTVALDSIGWPMSAKPRDVTPEAQGNVLRASLMGVDDRAVLLFAEAQAIRARWINEEARGTGNVFDVVSKRSGNYWPAIERSTDGFWVAWEDNRDKQGTDLFLRKLGTGLESPPNTAEIRVTDYGGKGFNNVLVPALAIENNAMFVVYKLARNGKHTINRLLIPLSAQDLVGTGISNKPSPKDKKGDRVLGGNSVALNGENVPGDAPSIACGRDGCFVVWHGERGGAYAARLDSSTGSVVANPVLGAKASHPNIAANGDRDVLVTFYEGGRVKVAPLTRDGIGPSSTIGLIRIGGNEQTRPTVVSGIARGEWFVSWLDMEGKHSEVYVARVVCR